MPARALAVDKVRYVGDPVALVVAETRALAMDAAELVDIDYDELPVVIDLDAAVADDAPLQFEDLGSNVATRRRDPDRSDPFEAADHVVRVRMVNQRIATAPIEGNAVLVDPTGDGADRLGVDPAPPPGPRPARRDARPDQGRGPRRRAPCRRRLRRQGRHRFRSRRRGAGRPAAPAPVKWTETRSEAMLSMQGRGQVQYAEMGLTSEGRIVGMRLRVLGECGAYAGFGGALAVGPTYLMSQGTYDIPEMRFDALGVMTNTAPVGAFRGAGRPEAAACIERLIDVAADELGIAPEEIRRRNLIQPDAFPFKTHSGVTYDTGDYDLPLREALRVADIDGARAEQQRRRDAGETRLLGIGISVYVEITGFGGSEFGSVQVHQDGSATVMSGTSSHGQGHATSFSMIVADRLGIPIDKITYRQSDTALVRTGGGTGGSRSLQLGGNAVGKAADEVREKAVELAAKMLEAAPADVDLDDATGEFRVAGVPDSSVGWTELAAYAHEHEGGLGVDTDFTQKGATFPFGAHVAIVEVDTDTGRVTPVRHVAVDDCGRILNPLIVAGQQHGGAVQGMSQALWEEFVYDDQGTPLTATFVDYALPTAADTIMLETSNTETPTHMNPMGAKGIGESATIGSTPAVQNAVVDALSHLGVRHIDLPCTPERVWLAIDDAVNGGSPDLWREPPAAFDAEPDSDDEPDVIEA